MFRSASLLAFTLAAVVYGQQVGTNTAENHPALQISQCTSGGSCTTQSKSVVLDANWRWLHTTTGFTNCYTGNTWDSSICTSPTTCASSCALDGADYSGTYGITTSGNALTLKFVTKGSNTNIGSRVYLLDDDSHYKLFNLKNQEFTFDVDMSQLPCGLNGALYFSEMEADGGLAKNTGNKAGAKYGTGYCDSQCPHDLKFINGEANILDWTGSSNDANSGTGRYGACCSEMDIWEANSMASAYTPHPCTSTGILRCSGNDCGDGSNRYGGVCDKDGCDFNSFRMGDRNFLGKGKTIDTTKKITVVTQFITDTGSASGKLTEIRRLYVQNGVVYQNSNTNIAGIPSTNSVTDSWCAAQKTAFGDTNSFANKGGLSKMGDAFQNGMALVLSVWDDHAANMLWLDSNYPLNKDASTPGVARGECATSSGVPADVESQSPNAQVIFSNIKYGPIGSTYSGTPGTPGTPGNTSQPPSSTVPSTSAPSPTATVPKYGQCGGINYSGPTACASGSTCTKLNDYYSQCL